MNLSKVLFLLNENKDSDFSISDEVIGFLNDKGVVVYAEEAIHKHFKNTKLFNQENVDFAIVLGGDGTILNFAHKYKEYDLPFFGINIGRVGCLAEGTVEAWKEQLENVISNNFFIEERNVIRCQIYDGDNLKHDVVSFNEVVIHRGNLYKMLLVNMEINNHNKTLFYADGVLISTATGSSAYNLSCGGPLLLPTSRNFVITPISPQLRTITSLVVNDTELVSINLHDEQEREKYTENKPVVFIDGAMRFEIDDKSTIEISKSNRVLKIIKINKEASLFEPTHKVASSTQKMFLNL